MSDGAFLEKARELQRVIRKPDSYSVARQNAENSDLRMKDACWPEILAVVEAARRYKNETITAHRLQMVETLDALDAKAEGL